MNINDILKIGVENKASDVHLKVGSSPVLRIDGELRPLNELKRLMQEDTVQMAFSMMNGRQKQRFKEDLDLDVAYSVPGLGRFRVNVFQQRGTVGLVMRVIPARILTIRELMLPPVIEEICEERRGLVLCTGTTGSGKSTSLAGMVDHVNGLRPEHIITIEDPIEYLHRDKKAIVNQRELDVDTRSYAMALRAALRQDPDVILVGEMRDYETIETALHWRQRPGISSSRPCTPSTPRRRSTASSRSFRLTTRSRSAFSSGRSWKAIISLRLHATCRLHGPGARRPRSCVMTPYIRECVENKDKTKYIRDQIALGTSQYRHADLRPVTPYVLYDGWFDHPRGGDGAGPSNPDEFKLQASKVYSRPPIVAREEMESSVRMPFPARTTFSTSTTEGSFSARRRRWRSSGSGRAEPLAGSPETCGLGLCSHRDERARLRRLLQQGLGPALEACPLSSVSWRRKLQQRGFDRRRRGVRP